MHQYFLSHACKEARAKQWDENHFENVGAVQYDKQTDYIQVETHFPNETKSNLDLTCRRVEDSISSPNQLENLHETVP